MIEIISLFLQFGYINLIEKEKSDNFDFTEFIDFNFEEIMKLGGEKIWISEKSTKFLIQIINDTKLLEFTWENNVSIMTAVIKHQKEDISWSLLNKILPSNISLDEKNKRLKFLLKKDNSNLACLDYAFLKNQNGIIQYIQTALESEEKINYKLPKLWKIYLKKSLKTKNQLSLEKTTLKKFKKISNIEVSIKNLNKDENLFQDQILYDEIFKLYHKELYEYFKNLNNKNFESSFFDLFTHNIKWEIIEDKESLDRVCKNDIYKWRLIGVDVEFSSVYQHDIEETEYKIRKIASSIQISTFNKSYFIDCLKLHEYIYKYLNCVFSNSKIVKIFHAPESDCLVLYNSFGILISNIYDTSKSSIFLDNKNQAPGLGQLTYENLNLELDKSYQVATWRVRPLPKPMIKYGISDSVVLIGLFYVLMKKTKETNNYHDNLRLIWIKCNNIFKWIKFNKYNIKFNVIVN